MWRRTSGAKYCGVPQNVDATFSLPTSFARPKSAIFTVGASGSFGGLSAEIFAEFAEESAEEAALSAPLGLGELFGEFVRRSRLGSSRIFSGLRSRWTMDASCKYCRGYTLRDHMRIKS